MGRLGAKRAIITGGASGLGAATARRFAEEGAAVAVVDLPEKAERGAALVAELNGIGADAHFVAGDVLDASSIRDAIDHAATALAGVDLCVASAGVAGHPDAGFRGLLDLQPQHFDFVHNVNVRGVFLTAQRAAQLMIAAGHGGSIVTLASIAAKRPSAGAYSVSKAAVWMLTRSLAGELAPYGIRVNAIGPAYVKTEMLARIARQAVGDDEAAQQAWYDQRAAQLPLGTLPTPLDVANTALFLCSDEAASFTGSILHPDGGMNSASGGG
ncbi:MAG: SDR family NAD(P)-dependent oxidoreductase [Ilumatobacteraceae bacterium]